MAETVQRMREATRLRRIFFTRRRPTYSSGNAAELMIALAKKLFGAENSKNTKGESSKKEKSDDKGKKKKNGESSNGGKSGRSSKSGNSLEVDAI